MAKKIIYQTEEGVAGIMTPTEDFLNSLPVEWSAEQKLVHVADKDLPTGTQYDIIDETEVPTDRTFRDAWAYTPSADARTSQELSNQDKVKYNILPADFVLPLADS